MATKKKLRPAPLNKPYTVLVIDREKIQSLGFNTSTLTDTRMKKLAHKFFEYINNEACSTDFEVDTCLEFGLKFDPINLP